MNNPQLRPSTVGRHSSNAPRGREDRGGGARDVIAMASLGAGMLLFEVLLTRIAAIALFANLAFAAIAIALLGMAVGGWVAATHEGRMAGSTNRRAGIALVVAAAGALAAILLTSWVPFVPDAVFRAGREVHTYSTRLRAVSRDPLQLNWWVILPATVLYMVPFGAGAYVQALLLGRRSGWAGTLYAVDVGGACVGAWSALWLVPLLGAENAVAAVILLFSGAALVMLPQGSMRWRAGAIGLAVMASILAGTRPISILHAAGFAESRVVDVSWSTLARVSLYEGRPGKTVKDRNGKRADDLRDPVLLVDNTSRSKVAFTGQKRFRRNLDRLAMSLKPRGDVLIIGAGGGQEIVDALETSTPGTARHIDAVEVADGIPRLMRKHFGERPGFILDQPGVNYVVGDGRSFIEMRRGRWSVIQMKEVNFHSLAGQASAAWSPSLLFTREAFQLYLEHLENGGILSIVKFYPSTARANTLHLLVTLRAAMAREGLDTSPRVIIVDRKYSYGLRRMLLVGRQAWTDDQLAFVDRYARAHGLSVARSPRKPASDKLVEAATVESLSDVIAKVFRKTGLVLSPVVDDRPFGHQHVPYLTAIRGERANRQYDADLALQTANFRALTAIVGVFLLIAGALIALFVRGVGPSVRSRAVSQLALCASLGFGFMLLEVVLVERASLLLGHPTVGFVTILTAMLLALATGSALSKRLGEGTPAGVPWIIVGVAIGGVAILPSVLPVLAPWLRGSVPVGWRPVVVGGTVYLGSLALGFFLPSTIRAVGRDRAASVAHCWAANGATSVLGTVSAALLVRTVGFRATGWVAVAAYVLAGLLWHSFVLRSHASDGAGTAKLYAE